MRRSVFLLFMLLLNSLFLMGCAQQGKEIDSIRKELKELKEGQERLIKDIHSIKRFLRIPDEFKEAIINISDEPFKGDKDAKVTLIEFTDYQ
ncbi:MAG: hypothetical protein Fur0020_15740 [Thermodesulfovibrionia bacterium]